MKVTAQIFLIIFFILFFFVGLISATFKFQLLSYSFWQNTFEKYNVYQNLAVVSKDSFNSQVTKEGGNKNDVKILTDLITPENAKELIDRNLQNFLSFVNGKVAQMNVYLPVDKVPANLLPKNITGDKTVIPITDLLTKFNFQNSQNLPLEEISRVGTISYYLFIGSAFLFLLVLILLILLVEKGSTFVGIGIAFMICGGLTFLLSNVATGLNSVLTKDLTTSTSIAAVVAGTMIPPVITEILPTWKILGIILFFFGFVLFFIKKPSYNSPK